MKKIVFIDDDALIIKIYSTRLTADGYAVYAAENGRVGIDLIKKHNPDLIVLDIMMPHLDGFGVLEHTQSDTSMKDIPVIIFSNMSKQEEIDRAKKMGAKEFVIKADISPSDMIKKIKSYLR